MYLCFTFIYINKIREKKKNWEVSLMKVFLPKVNLKLAVNCYLDGLSWVGLFQTLILPAFFSLCAWEKKTFLHSKEGSATGISFSWCEKLFFVFFWSKSLLWELSSRECCILSLSPQNISKLLLLTFQFFTIIWDNIILTFLLCWHPLPSLATYVVPVCRLNLALVIDCSCSGTFLWCSQLASAILKVSILSLINILEWLLKFRAIEYICIAPISRFYPCWCKKQNKIKQKPINLLVIQSRLKAIMAPY